MTSEVTAPLPGEEPGRQYLLDVAEKATHQPTKDLMVAMFMAGWRLEAIARGGRAHFINGDRTLSALADENRITALFASGRSVRVSFRMATAYAWGEVDI